MKFNSRFLWQLVWCGVGVIFFISACSPRKKLILDSPQINIQLPQAEEASELPKNIVLMIADGMGLSQITGSMYQNGNKTVFERCSHTGLMKTHAVDDLITDSAASGTAMACGIKTYNGAVGVDPDTLSHVSLTELAEQKNMATGIVVTSSLVHATPACFTTHQPQRYWYEEIALDLLDLPVDLLIGGGKQYFTKNRKDRRNLLDSLKQKGYLITNRFKKIDPIEPGQKVCMFTADDHPLSKIEGRTYFPRATAFAVKFLSEQSKKGFFMMAEGSQIDWGGHARDADYMMAEMQDFEKAVAKVLDFARQNGNTLVVITSDHETGGYSVNQGSEMKNIKAAFTTNQHTAAMVPVFAYGPGAKNFTGIYENTDIYHKIAALLDR